jgi:hypothetical protein
MPIVRLSSIVDEPISLGLVIERITMPIWTVVRRENYGAKAVPDPFA